MHAYHFAATDIQSYLLDGGKLKDVVGASEIIETLTGSLLDEVLECIDISKHDIQFTRCSGGVFTVVSERRDLLENLRDFWSLALQQFAPGLSFVHAIGQGEDPKPAMDQAHHLATLQRGYRLPVLPQAGPLIERNARNGQPVTSVRGNKDIEYLDSATDAKRQKRFRQGPALILRISPDGRQKIKWPTLLTDDGTGEEDHVFPFKGEDTNLALIHADGNNMGKIIADLDKAHIQPKQYPEMMFEFSKAVTQTTQNAAKHAVDYLLEHAETEIAPGRPIVLGGDDFTMIVRADLALAFTSRFLEEFTLESRKAMEALQKNHYPVPNQLTASAGISYIHANQPFHMAYQLAESLCRFSKGKTRSESSISFFRLTTSLADSYEEILEKQLIKEKWKDGKKLLLTCQPYSLSELESLRKLAKWLKAEQAKSTSRALIGMLHISDADAKKHYQRWRDNMHPVRMETFDRLMNAFGPLSRDFPVVDMGQYWATPLLDALSLLAIGDTSDD